MADEKKPNKDEKTEKANKANFSKKIKKDEVNKDETKTGSKENINQVNDKKGGSKEKINEANVSKTSLKDKRKGGEDEEEKNKTVGDKMQEALKQQKEEESDDEKPAFFERKVSPERFSIWNFDIWIDQELKDSNFLLKIFVEILIVSIIFIGPSAYWLSKNYKSLSLSKYFSSPGPLKKDQESLFRLGLFVTLCFAFERFVCLINDNLLPIIGYILNSLCLDDSEIVWSIMDNLNTSSDYLKNSLVAIFVYKISNDMFQKFKKPQITDFLNTDTLKAVVLSYGVYMGLMFIMKFCVYILIYDIKKSSYSSYICDLNHKIFIYKKLKAISEAESEAEIDDIVQNMNPIYDPGFYLIDRDFFISQDDAKIVAQNIMALLKTNKLTYEDIEKYFPENQDNVFKFLARVEEINDDSVISVNTFKSTAKELYLKRDQMSRTLRDRNSIFEKLEFIFSLIVNYITAIIICYIFDINYKIYLASFGTTIITFSWIFADVIKQIFNCFVFILVIRPFDIGDRVKIDDNDYVVHKIDLLNTTFLTSLDKLIYISNISLMSSKIHNYARSPPESFRLELMVDGGTSYDKAVDLAKKVEPEIKKMKKHFTDIKFLEITDGKLSYIIFTTHNFQNVDLENSKKNKLIKIFEDGMKKSGINYKNSFAFTH